MLWRTPLYNMIFNTNSSSSPTTKKRKSNDGRAATDCAHDVNIGNTNDGGGFLTTWFGYFSGQRDESSSGSGPPHENNTTQLNRMEKIMMRMEEKMAGMEEKLSTVGNLERRCEELERKCSSLENMLESTSKATKEHIDRKCDSLADRLETNVDSLHKKADKALKHHEFNEMMLKNHSWEYSAEDLSADDLIHDGYTAEEAEYLSRAAKELKEATTTMRRGEYTFHSEVIVDMGESYPPFSYDVNNELLPHWEEFAAALDQFTPAINLLPENCESAFTFYWFQMNNDAMLMMKKALMGKPFQNLHFLIKSNEDDAHGATKLDTIIDVVKSNKHLRRLEIFRHDIGSQHIDRLCSAVRNHPSLVQLELFNCYDSGVGDEMFASLLTIDDLKLEKLKMSRNGITSAVSTLLADFLATNSRLRYLNLDQNRLYDSDAVMIASALRSNTTLSRLDLDYNDITDAGKEALRRVLWDDSSLNAAADTNHVCFIDFLNDWNAHEEKEINRGMKIYHLLSLRNKTMSNAQHLGDIDVKILPNMLAAVQKYHDASTKYDLTNELDDVKPLSIVYEIMRKWDKAFPLYKSMGVECMC